MLQNPLKGVVDDAPAVVQSRMYQNGRGVPQDDAEAAKWFRLAAEQGDAEAQHNLGVMYDNVSSSIFREWSRRKPRPLELRNRE